MYSALKLVSELQATVQKMKEVIQSGPFMRGTSGARQLNDLAKMLVADRDELGSSFSYNIEQNHPIRERFSFFEDAVSEVLRGIRVSKLDPEILIAENKLRKLFLLDLKDAERDLRRLRQELRKLETDY